VSAGAIAARERRESSTLDVPDLKAAGDSSTGWIASRSSTRWPGAVRGRGRGARGGAQPRGKVFLDLKLHDIPETGARAVSSAMALGAELLTLHTSGGLAMMKRAAQAAQGRAKLTGRDSAHQPS